MLAAPRAGSPAAASPSAAARLIWRRRRPRCRHEASYPLSVLSQRTPAWREVYSEILDGLSARYTTFWAAVDWLTQFGDDKDRDNYPKFWRGTVLPAHLFDRGYNTPGWTGNGLGPKGVENDPIEAEAMLFFKGFMLMLMSLTSRISGNDKVGVSGRPAAAWPCLCCCCGGCALSPPAAYISTPRPLARAQWLRTWTMAGVGDTKQEWTLDKVADHLHEQWSARDCGLH